MMDNLVILSLDIQEENGLNSLNMISSIFGLYFSLMVETSLPPSKQQHI